VPADQVTNFDTLYRTHCAGCHGADGKLGPAPPLNDPLFLALIPDDELLRVIREGRAVAPGKKTPMPAFSVGAVAPLSPAQAEAWTRLKEEAHANPRQQGPLTPAQVEVLARGIKKRWGPAASPPPSMPPYLAPAGTGSGKKEEGVVAFARACAGCHGMQGEGIEKDGKLRRKINDQAFLALISDQQLRRYIITGRPDLGMPPYDRKDGRPPYDRKDGRPPEYQPLSSEEIGGLVQLLACWRLGGTDCGK
jgi:mono/diheme cytochrome c family protein